MEIASASSDQSQPFKQSQLYKKGKRKVLPFWETRWFVAETGMLKWFSVNVNKGVASKGKLKNEIPLNSIVHVFPVPVSQEERPFQFALHTNDAGVRMLAGYTAESRDQWIAFLKEYIVPIEGNNSNNSNNDDGDEDEDEQRVEHNMRTVLDRVKQ